MERREHDLVHDHIGTVRGFSFIELLIALALGSLIIVSMYELLTVQDRFYTHQDDIAEMQQSLRVAMERVSRDITMAGFGKPLWSTVNGSDLSSWYYSPSYYPVQITTSGSNSVLNIMGCLDQPAGHLSSAANSGSTTITLQSGQGSNFNTSTKSDISIGGRENGKVTAVSGDTLTIDTSTASSGNQSLVYSYAVNTPVYIVKRVTYSVDTATTPPSLVINENQGAGNQQVAQCVSGMTVTRPDTSKNLWVVTLTGQTRRKDYTTGQYVAQAMTNQVVVRNE
jgi:prepilin-type N-terminal cleavage/methylation domain-containing protein